LEAKRACESVKKALDILQKLIAKLRRFTAVRESLGTSLHVPCDTRWISKLNMVECFLDSKTKILDVIRDKKPDLIEEVESIYTNYGSAYEDYRKLVTPIKKRIVQLEVSELLLNLFNVFLGR